jgi:hypothetical protein
MSSAVKKSFEIILFSFQDTKNGLPQPVFRYLYFNIAHYFKNASVFGKNN